MHGQRKFSLNQLRQSGFGKDVMHGIITKEAAVLVDVVSSKYRVSASCYSSINNNNK